MFRSDAGLDGFGAGLDGFGAGTEGFGTGMARFGTDTDGLVAGLARFVDVVVVGLARFVEVVVVGMARFVVVEVDLAPAVVVFSALFLARFSRNALMSSSLDSFEYPRMPLDFARARN